VKRKLETAVTGIERRKARVTLRMLADLLEWIAAELRKLI